MAPASTYHTPAPVWTLRAADSDHHAHEPREHPPADGHWWRRLGGEELDRQVARLRRDNHDLVAARERTAQQLAAFRSARSARLPSVNASLQSEHDDADPPDSTTSNTSTSSGTSHRFTIDLDWSVDLFGELRAVAQSNELALEARRLDYVATEQRVIAELVRLQVAASTAAKRLDLARTLSSSFEQTVSLTEQRLRAGAGATSALDVQIARQNLASSRSALPALQAQLHELRLNIEVLQGRVPGLETPSALAIIDPRALEPLSRRAPSRILEQRSDVASAELGLRAAEADVQVARARRLPGLSLGLSLGAQGDSLDAVFDVGDWIRTVTGRLVAPLFQGGRLQAEVARARARARELAASYAGVVVGARRDVLRAIALEAARDEQLARLDQTVAAARLADRLADERYASGQLSLLALLETRRALDNARQELADAEQARLDARIDLHLALGGDWQTAPVTAARTAAGETPS